MLIKQRMWSIKFVNSYVDDDAFPINHSFKLNVNIYMTNKNKNQY